MKLHYHVINGIVAIVTIVGCPEPEAPNNEPAADAGEDRSVLLPNGAATVVVQLDGAASSDDRDAIVNYNWTGRDGAPDPSNVVAPFVSLEVGEYEFDLVVTDDFGAVSLPSTVRITVVDSLVSVDYDFLRPELLQLNGDARLLDDFFAIYHLILTNGPHQAASAFVYAPLVRDSAAAGGGIPAFSTRFVFRATQLPDVLGNGDGLTFALTTSPAAYGVGGGELGLNEVTPSVAVEFDFYQGPGDPAGDHVALMVNGDNQANISATNTAIPLASGEDVVVWIDYAPASPQGASFFVAVSNDYKRPPLNEFVWLTGVNPDDHFPVDQPVYVGLTAATGAAASNIELRSWEFEAHPN